MESVILILSDQRGIYIPRDFLTDSYNELAVEHCVAWGLTENNFENWKEAIDPESEFYWDAWQWILSSAQYIDVEGNKYTLWQDGNLWGICYDRMSSEEKINFGFE